MKNFTKTVLSILFSIILFVFLFFVFFFLCAVFVGLFFPTSDTLAIPSLFLSFVLAIVIVLKIIKKRKSACASDEPPPVPSSLQSESEPDKPCCSYCGSRVPAGAYICWHCGKKLPISPEQHTKNMRSIPFLILFIIAVVLMLPSGRSDSVPQISKGEYIFKCQTIPYKTLARNPESHKGEYLTFTGEVIQVVESGNTVNLRVNVTANSSLGSTYYSDTIFVVTHLDEGGDRILERDIITLYGVCQGLYSYKTILGAQATLPRIDAQYWEIDA